MTAPAAISGNLPTDMARSLAANIEKVIRGQPQALRLLMAAFLSGGHVLLEDYPGTGKTTLAKALARSIDVHFQRVQFTPDLLPADILGVSIFEPAQRAFRFHRGPVFSNVLLADEINRASPRTQSALLEAMAEAQVSVDGVRYPLEDLFFVIATQNPIEFHGTYPLPEAQMDRFALRFGLGYVDREAEVGILSDQSEAHPLEAIQACAGLDEIVALKQAVTRVRISEELKHYIVDLVAATRASEGLRMGASPRASLTLMKASQALSLYDGLDYVTPDLIQELAAPVMAHRVALDPQAHFGGETAEGALRRCVEAVPIPT